MDNKITKLRPPETREKGDIVTGFDTHGFRDEEGSLVGFKFSDLEVQKEEHLKEYRGKIPEIMRLVLKRGSVIYVMQTRESLLVLNREGSFFELEIKAERTGECIKQAFEVADVTSLEVEDADYQMTRWRVNRPSDFS